MEVKKLIRKELLNKRDSLPAELCQKYSTLIEGQLLSSEQYNQADTLLIYASYRNEVSTYGIIKHALMHQKRVFCPKVSGPGNMEFYRIHSLEDLKNGYKNIPEPLRREQPYVHHESSRTLMVMPLVGYDLAQNRIGYGGGFYDRYLQNFPSLSKIALGYELQKYEDCIPVEATDIKPDHIITEKTIY